MLIGLPVAVVLSEIVSLVTAKLVGMGIIGHQDVYKRQRLTCKAFSSMYSVVPHSAMQSCSVVTRASPPDKRATNSFP